MIGTPAEAGVPSVRSHSFTPRGAWCTLCRICGLAMPAHTNSTVKPELAERYRCPNCVERGAKSCTHRSDGRQR